MAKYFCDKCGRELEEVQFYTYRDGRKTELCKKCLTMHIDNYEPETFLWLLEKMDVPYIEEEWNVIREKAYAKDPSKMNGMSVFGKYLSRMKLKQFKDFRSLGRYRNIKSEKRRESCGNGGGECGKTSYNSRKI